MQSSNRPIPPIAQALITDFGWRHVKGVMLTRTLVAAWLVALGTYFCLTGRWWGAFLYLAAAINGLLAYLTPRWKAAIDAQQGTESGR